MADTEATRGWPRPPEMRAASDFGTKPLGNTRRAAMLKRHRCKLDVFDCLTVAAINHGSPSSIALAEFLDAE